MKRILLLGVLLLPPAASAKGLLPCMVYRRGLTNEQVDGILAAHPTATVRITAQDWRGMQYQLYRFHNMTNYVELIGNSNDCARLLLKLHDRAETLSSSNSVLERLERKWEETASAAAGRAEEYAAAYAAATNRIGNVEAKLDERRAEYVQKRDAAALPTTRAIYQAFIDAIDKIKEAFQ